MTFDLLYTWMNQGFESCTAGFTAAWKRFTTIEQDVKNLDTRVKQEREQEFRIIEHITARLERIEKKQAEPVKISFDIETVKPATDRCYYAGAANKPSKSYRAMSAEEWWEAQREKAYRDAVNAFRTPAPVTAPTVPTPSEEAETLFCYGERVRSNPAFRYWTIQDPNGTKATPYLKTLYKRSFGIVIPRPYDRAYRKGVVWCICADNQVRGAHYTHFTKVSGDPR